MKSIVEKDDKLLLFAERYKDDAFRDIDIIYYAFASDSLKTARPFKGNNAINEEGRLMERINGLWVAFMEDDYQKVYLFNDPFFRARNRVEEYLTRRGRIKYHSYNIGEIHIEGRIAKVNMDIVYSVPQMMWHGEKFSRPETKASFVDTWIFLDNEWYREYKEETADFTYTRY
jgi:hypothetical protein